MNNLRNGLRRVAWLSCACLLVIQPVYAADTPASLTPDSWKTAASAAATKALPYMRNYYAQRDPSNMVGWASVALEAAGLPMTTSSDGAEIDAKQSDIEANGVGTTTTDYDSLLLGAIAAGQNPRAFGHVDLIRCLLASERADGKFADQISGSGEDLVNAQLWSIIALHAAGQSIPNADDALAWITEHQHQDGGFTWSASVAQPDIDMTAMALLAYHALGQDGTNPAVQRAFQFLQHTEQQDGSFGDGGQSTAESTASAIEALVAFGMDPTSSPWQQENGNPVQALLSFRTQDGSFRHIAGGSANIMATVQAVTALGDFGRGQSVYDQMFAQSEIIKEDWSSAFSDLPPTNPGYTNLSLLVGMGVLAGYGDQTMRPSDPVTREQFAKMLVYALGDKNQLQPVSLVFKDVAPDRWSYGDIGITVAHRWVKGFDADHFGPQQKLTGAALMTILIRALGKDNEAAAQMGSNWYDGSVRVAQSEGLTYPGFTPMGDATRAHCAYSIVRLLQTEGN